jgi:hypothetical protein
MLLLLLLPFACITYEGGVPPQQWAKGRGPVVPHDSFPTDCRLCHIEGSWHRIRADFHFDHGKETGVELEGAHATAECLRCHNDRGPVQKYAAKGCAGCHEDWHRRQLGTNCADCHDQTTWRPKDSIAAHNRTRFPLIGAHAGVACFRCHQGAPVGNFKRADTRCESCHQQDLARATAPNHLAAGWTADCQRCHLPVSWTGSSFVHASFPLNGAHQGLECSRCHSGGVFTGTPRICICCHQADNYGTTAPNHVAASFPTSCETCHNTSSWEGALFNHRFPLRSEHNVSCATCHTAPGNFAQFSCIGCHAHRRTEMDDEHDEVSGYSYVSSACVACHPNGR